MVQFIRAFIQKLLAARAFVRIIKDPNRLDDVFGLSDSTNAHEILKRNADRFAMFPKGAKAVQECRRLPAYQLNELVKLPAGTLGHEFAHHMISRGLDPAAIPTLNAKDPAEFVRAHLYETHDIWHVVTGFGTDVAGELGLQGFYMAQVQGPLPPSLLAAGLLNTAFIAIEEFDLRMRNIVVGWRAGKRATPFFGTNWDQLWETPLTEVRLLHGLDERGVVPELALESEIMVGFGGVEAYEQAQARLLGDKRSTYVVSPQLRAQVS